MLKINGAERLVDQKHGKQHSQGRGEHGTVVGIDDLSASTLGKQNSKDDGYPMSTVAAFCRFCCDLGACARNEIFPSHVIPSAVPRTFPLRLPAIFSPRTNPAGPEGSDETE